MFLPVKSPGETWIVVNIDANFTAKLAQNPGYRGALRACFVRWLVHNFETIQLVPSHKRTIENVLIPACWNTNKCTLLSDNRSMLFTNFLV